MKQNAKHKRDDKKWSPNVDWYKTIVGCKKGKFEAEYSPNIKRCTSKLKKPKVINIFRRHIIDILQAEAPFCLQNGYYRKYGRRNPRTKNNPIIDAHGLDEYRANVQA